MLFNNNTNVFSACNWLRKQTRYNKACKLTKMSFSFDDIQQKNFLNSKSCSRRFFQYSKEKRKSDKTLRCFLQAVLRAITLNVIR